MAAGRVVVVVVAALALFGCAGPLPWAQPTPTPRVVDCAALAKKGVRPCPPDSPALDNPRVINRTDGHLPDATAQRWARAFLRTIGYDDWAVTHNSDQLLKSGILTSPEHAQQVFGLDINHIQAAKSVGGTLQVTNPALVELVLVSVPSQLRQGLAREGYHAQDYALVVRYRGAERVDLIAGNTSKTLASVGSDGRADQFEWGRQIPGSPLGPVWQIDGVTACTSDAAFQALCAP